MTAVDPSRGPTHRIDKWLWCARRFRSRSLAAKFISAGSVRVTRDGETHRIDRPGFLLREKDVVSFMLGERIVRLAVVGFAERRGPPASASLVACDLDGRPDAASCKVAG